MIDRDSAVRLVHRASVVSLVGHVLFAAGMIWAAMEQDDSAPFWLLAVSGLVGGAAAAVLKASATPSGQGHITTATALMAVSFVAGVAAAFLGGSPAYLIAPVVLLFANAMLVGAARRVHSVPVAQA